MGLALQQEVRKCGFHSCNSVISPVRVVICDYYWVHVLVGKRTNELPLYCRLSSVTLTTAQHITTLFTNVLQKEKHKDSGLQKHPE